MNKDDLVAAVAAESGVSKADADRVLKALGNVAQATLKAGNELTLPGVAKISVKARPARVGRNPSNGEAIQIAASNTAKFTVLKALKDALK